MRLPHVIPFSKSPIYYFTSCTAGRRPVLAGEAAYRSLVEVWEKSAALDGWYVGRFVLMPDHVHFFATPVIDAKSRGNWIKMWKSVIARHLVQELKLQPPIWQEDTFDHILRGRETYEEKWNYVRENPVRAGLCAVAQEWPWQGETYTLRMK